MNKSGVPRGVLTGLPATPEFLLGSVPSEDKSKLYNHITKTLQPGAQTELLELYIEVSVISGNGSTLQTWEYEDCSLKDYIVFLNFDSDDYRWIEEEDKSEIREVFLFQCQGIDFKS